MVFTSYILIGHCFKIMIYVTVPGTEIVPTTDSQYVKYPHFRVVVIYSLDQTFNRLIKNRG